MELISWAKRNPLEAGGIGLVGVLAALWLLGFFSSSSGSSSGDPNAAAYFAAESAEAQSGNALQAVQIQAQAGTAQDLINAGASETNNTTWANTDYATTVSNNATSVTNTAANDATAVSLAPFQVQSNLISTLGQVASQPPTTIVSQYSESDGGFFGLGASSSSGTNTSVIPNQSAEEASGILGELLGNGFIAGH